MPAKWDAFSMEIEFETEWSAEALMGLGAIALGSFLVFIYFVSP